MQRCQGYAATQAGVRSPGATVTVYLASDGVTPATLYSTNDPTAPLAQANPFAADANGYYTFYARNGRYSVKVAGGTVPIAPAITVGDLLLFDPLDQLPGQLPAGWIDVRAYGAACDGITDDTAAVRRALAAAATPTGGVIVFPARTTTVISDTLVATGPNITLQGGGPDTVIAFGGVGNVDFFQTANYAGITIKDLAVTKTVADLAGYFVRGAVGSDDLRILRCGVTTFGGGVFADTCARVRIQNCTFVAPAIVGVGIGINLTGCPDAVLTTVLVSVFPAAIVLVSCDHFEGIDLDLRPDALGTLTAFSVSNSVGVHVLRLVGRGFGRGVIVSGCDQLELVDPIWVTTITPLGGTVNNVIEVDTSTRVAIRGFQAPSLTNIDASVQAIACTSSDDVLVDGATGVGANVFFGAHACQRVTVTNCSWQQTHSNVLVVEANCLYYRIIGNVFYNNSTGIAVQPGCDHGILANNHIILTTGTFGTGIAIIGAHYVAVRGNTIVSMRFNGIDLENAGNDPSTWSNFCQIVNNYLYNNGCFGDNPADGIYAQNLSHMLIEGNQCLHNGRHGIFVNGGTLIDIVGNTCDNNGQNSGAGVAAGIVVDTSNRTKIVANTAGRLAQSGLDIGAQAYGIYHTAACATGLVTANLCAGNVTANLRDNSAGTVTGSNQTA